MNRTDFMKKTGHLMKNKMWSWSGVNHEDKSVMITTWDHYKNPENSKQYLVFHSDWGVEGKDSGSPAGRSEAVENLRLVQEEGYQLKMVFAEAESKFPYPVSGDEGAKIKKLKSSFYFEADLVVDGDFFFGELARRVNI